MYHLAYISPSFYSTSSEKQTDPKLVQNRLKQSVSMICFWIITQT